MTNQNGAQLFCRYAYSPNELGFCGPSGAEYLAQVARGEASPEGVRPIARQFSGAWVYQRVIGDLLGLDALDETVVRGYWTGNAEVAGIDREAFWQKLIAIIGPEAGMYWKHLNDSLAPEANPSHAFHVLGVYPWTRLLGTGRPEPLTVLNGCLIRPGTVLEAIDGNYRVATRELVYSDGQLHWQDAETQIPALFDKDLPDGTAVAIHWNGICDLLSVEQTARLNTALDTQVGLTNQRL
jgi:hypothetical protein